MRVLRIIFILMMLSGTASATTSIIVTNPYPSGVTARMSVGIYKLTNGSPYLKRTLVSGIQVYATGAQSLSWDGNDDFGNALPSDTYQVRALLNVVEPYWDGAVGNTSSNRNGSSVWSCFFPALDVCSIGTNIYVCTGDSEGKLNFKHSSTNNPQFVYNQFGGSSNNAANNAAAGTLDRNWIAMSVNNSNWLATGCPQGLAGSSAAGFFMLWSNDVQLTMSSGGVVLEGDNYPNGMYVGTQGGLSGLAIQPFGAHIAVPVGPDNRVYSFTLPNAVSNYYISVSSPGRCCCDTNGNLWVISGTSTVYGITNWWNSSHAVFCTISGLDNPLGIAASPLTTNEIVVALGGTHQQLAAYAPSTGSGSLLWTYGVSGGQVANGPLVNTNIFYLVAANMKNAAGVQGFSGAMASLCFASDGSIWMTDGGNQRMLHISGDSPPKDLNQMVMWSSEFYTASVDPTIPSRVTSWFLEFSNDFSGPLSNHWTLSKNWGASVDTAHYFTGSTAGILNTLTLNDQGTNRSYCLMNNTNQYWAPLELVEMTSTGLRFTGKFPWPTNDATRGSVWLDAQGNSFYSDRESGRVWEAGFSNFDSLNNIVWSNNSPSLYCSSTSNSIDPIPLCCGLPTATFVVSRMTNGAVPFFRPDPESNVWHVGFVEPGGTNFWASTCFAGTHGLLMTGGYEDRDLQYLSGGNVVYVGGSGIACDSYFINTQPVESFLNQYEAGAVQMWYSNGLYLTMFGETVARHSINGLYGSEQPIPSRVGNMSALAFYKTNALSTTGVYGYYFMCSDESQHGPQRFHLQNLQCIVEETNNVALNGSVDLGIPTWLSFPSSLTVSNGNGFVNLTWPLNVANAISWDIRTSPYYGGPYSLATNVFTNQYTLTNLVNGTVSYVVVVPVVSGVEQTPSMQVEARPFDSTSYVLATGQASDGLQFGGNGGISDITSGNLSSGLPTLIDAERDSNTNLNFGDWCATGFGDFAYKSAIGTMGYYLPNAGGGSSLSISNLNGNFVVSPSGWTDNGSIVRAWSINGSIEGSGGVAHGFLANPNGSITITPATTNAYYMTVFSGPVFSDAEQWTMTCTGTSGSQSYTVNLTQGQNIAHQFLCRGNQTLTVASTLVGGNYRGTVTGLFFDSATPAIAFTGGGGSSPYTSVPQFLILPFRTR